VSDPDTECYTLAELSAYATNTPDTNLVEWDKIRKIQRICESHKGEIWQCLTKKIKLFLMGKLIPENIYILDLYLYLYPYKSTMSVKISFFRMPERTAIVETQASLEELNGKFAETIRELFPDSKKEITVELEPKYSKEG